jgi:hypothetical protein
MAGRVFVFVGPTLAKEAVREMLPDCTILPPVAAGDLLRLPAAPGDLVAILDGYYYQSPAVRHKEILALLDRGVIVAGAASMGALRAAELGPFGMRGYGAIFAAYRDGAIEGDDEVAVLHAPEEEGYVALSEALVNVRHNCERAVQAGVVAAEAAAQVLGVAAALPFHQRTYREIWDRAAAAGVAEAALTSLGAFIARERSDLKREDAVLLLRAVAEGRVAGGAGEHFELHETSFLREWREEEAGRQVAGVGFVPDTEVLTYIQLFAPDYPQFHYRSALEGLAALYSRDLDLPIPGGDALLWEFRREKSVRREPAFRLWLEEHFLQPDELAAHLEDRARVEALVRWSGCSGDEEPLEALAAEYGRKLGIFGAVDEAAAWTGAWLEAWEAEGLGGPQKLARVAVRSFGFFPDVPWRRPLIGRLKVGGAFGAALRGVAAARRFDEALRRSHGEFRTENVSVRRMFAWFRERWGVREGADPELVLRDRGFDSAGEFAARGGTFYLYDRARGVSGRRDEVRPEARSAHVAAGKAGPRAGSA